MSRLQRGFTLLEVLVSMGIAFVAVAAGLLILSTMNSSFTHQSGAGTAIAQSELAVDAIERAIRLAGTGIDPQMAFDFDFYNCALPPGGPMSTSLTESANCGTRTRDSNNAPDELVVAYRDPAYATVAPADGCTLGNAATYRGKVWSVTAAGAAAVTLVLKPGDVIYRGQVLQIVCADGLSYTYATVNNPQVNGPAAGCATQALALYPQIASDPYNQPNFLAQACFSAGGAQSAHAYAVRRNRFFIHRELGGANPRTYLMLDQGLDLNNDGQLTDADLWPIASDIEDLQFAYATEQPGIVGLAPPPGCATNSPKPCPTGFVKTTYVVDSNNNGVYGDDPAAAGSEQLSEPLVAGNRATAQFTAADGALNGRQACTNSTTNPLFQYPCVLGPPPVETSPASSDVNAYRWTAWPGNISQVLVGVIARAPVRDSPDQVSADELTIPLLLNRPAANSPTYPAWYAATRPDGRKRVVVRTGVRPANMALSRLFWN